MPTSDPVSDPSSVSADPAPGAPSAHAAPAAAPALRVRTLRLEDEIDLPTHLPRDLTAAWLRHGQGMVGVGTAWTCTTSGPDRFEEASARFRELAAAARIDDEVGTRGSGLIAFGSFSYAATSPRPSTLLVPRAILGVLDNDPFLTLVDVLDEQEDASDAMDRVPAAPADWRDLFPSTPRAERTHVQIDPDHTPDEYQELVRRALGMIEEGRAQKIVLSESSTVHLEQAQPVATLLGRLAESYPTTWVYHLADVIGATPEMLADTEHGRLFSRVLAGSRPVAEGSELAEQDRRAFRSDAKELAEHAFAIDSVTSRLADLTTEITASAEPFVLRLPGLEHLASDVAGELREGVTSLDVAGRLHPSAAVSGTPREAADAAIAELEVRDRGGYASPVGWMDAEGDGQWAIALRMAHLETPTRVRVQSGGGLVAGSDPVLEHAEALAKSRPVLRAIGRPQD
ncbi:chorismate-binding protein [Brachybacterium sp. MASK1Z-5]|uniref:Chorismate-binding protein n=1 Tax=Brachybacterium halotolerans TaxID=2795215 RepID=A0ABS1B9E1_9MICO|nr:chorismate-binding protein [Brachybacterium halotolerans]MBK0331265.1 chorismate-binding protein [Brachybacterium halotolerans]